MEAFYPLHVFVCDSCFLVQLQEYVAPENIFTEYAYFSSYSDSWLAHANSYSKRMIERFGFDRQSQVIELGSNDGYLLQYFVDARGSRYWASSRLRMSPSVAGEQGCSNTWYEFFGAELAAATAQSQGTVCGPACSATTYWRRCRTSTVLWKGIKILLKPHGVLTLEFPHLLRLIERQSSSTRSITNTFRIFRCSSPVRRSLPKFMA